MHIILALCVGGILIYFLVLWAVAKKCYKPVYVAGGYALLYLLLRLLGYNSWSALVDVLAWACLLIVMLVPLLLALRKRPVWAALTSIVLVLALTFALLLNGLLTEWYWMWDDSRRFIAHTPHGNLVALDGIDAGGLEYRKYSLRDEILWGIMFKEYDSKYLSSDCHVWLGKAGAQVHYDDCKKQVISVE